MKKFIITLILVIFSLGASVYAYDTIDAMIENGNIIIEYGDVKAQYISGKENTIISASYDGNGKLVGASFVKQESGRLTVKKVDGAVDVILWFSDFEGDAIFDLNILEKAVSTPEPLKTPAPTIEPTPVPEIEEEEEFIDEGFVGTEETEETEENYCNFSISCVRAIESGKLSEEKLSSLPENGIISQIKPYIIEDGMTVYDVLVKCAEAEGIEIDGSESYIFGINGLLEFNCGPLSGWVYTVNGERPPTPINMYVIQPNDEVAIQYTCNMGDDL